MSDDFGFEALAPGGYYVAIRVGFAFPEVELNTLPRAWIHHYTQGGLMLVDPVMRWIYDNTGTSRWSDIDVPDPRGVLAHAGEYGLIHGAAVSLSGDEVHGLRTFGTFGRPDRPYTDEELRLLSTAVLSAHRAHSPPDDLTAAELEALRLVGDGLLLKEAAYRLGISEGAVKQRLRSAKAKLNARTNAQAVSKADRFGLLN